MYVHFVYLHGTTIKTDTGYVYVARTKRYSYSTLGRSRLSASQGRFCSLGSVKPYSANVENMVSSY